MILTLSQSVFFPRSVLDVSNYAVFMSTTNHRYHHVRQMKEGIYILYGELIAGNFGRLQLLYRDVCGK